MGIAQHPGSSLLKPASYFTLEADTTFIFKVEFKTFFFDKAQFES